MKRDKTKTEPAVHGMLGEARGRLLTELCGRPQTAAELAMRVGTSPNAVRVHLTSLADSGLVEFVVERRGIGKPTHVYALTADAEYVLSKAYSPALSTLIDTLRHRLNGEFVPTLREAGAALGRARGSDGVTGAVAFLKALGASPSIRKTRSGTELRTVCCPLGQVTRRSPEACAMMESAVAEASGRPVREQCHRGPHPQCAFHLTTK